MKRRQLVFGVLALCSVMFVLWQVQPTGVAQRQGDIGVIDLEAIWSYSVLPALDGPLRTETARLQSELDREVEGKSEEEKQQIFDAYQAELYALQQHLVDMLLDDVRRVIGEVAEDLGISIVLDVNSVMYGGIDLTQPVLQRLGIEG